MFEYVYSLKDVHNYRDIFYDRMGIPLPIHGGNSVRLIFQSFSKNGSNHRLEFDFSDRPEDIGIFIFLLENTILEFQSAKFCHSAMGVPFIAEFDICMIPERLIERYTHKIYKKAILFTILNRENFRCIV